MKVNKIYGVLATLLLSLGCSSFVDAAGCGGGGDRKRKAETALASSPKVSRDDESSYDWDALITPLHIAARDGNIEDAKTLLAAAPDLHTRKALILQSNCSGETAEDWATMNGQYDIANMLRAEVTKIDAALITLVRVYAATLRGDYDFVKETLDAMDETMDATFINTLVEQEKYYSPLLHLAVFSHNADLVEELLISGALVNAPDTIGSIALHFAAFLGDEAIVTKLLEAEADITATNRIGKTAYDIAVARGNVTIAHLIRQEQERRQAAATGHSTSSTRVLD